MCPLTPRLDNPSQTRLPSAQTITTPRQHPRYPWALEGDDPTRQSWCTSRLQCRQSHHQGSRGSAVQDPRRAATKGNWERRTTGRTIVLANYRPCQRSSRIPRPHQRLWAGPGEARSRVQCFCNPRSGRDFLEEFLARRPVLWHLSNLLPRFVPPHLLKRRTRHIIVLSTLVPKSNLRTHILSGWPLPHHHHQRSKRMCLRKSRRHFSDGGKSHSLNLSLPSR